MLQLSSGNARIVRSINKYRLTDAPRHYYDTTFVVDIQRETKLPSPHLLFVTITAHVGVSNAYSMAKPATATRPATAIPEDQARAFPAPVNGLGEAAAGLVPLLGATGTPEGTLVGTWT